MAEHYAHEGGDLRIHGGPDGPQWRPPQLGAIGALIAHWSLHTSTPALISLPTGSGKIALALAAPYIVSAKRTLVAVPSRELRQQTVNA